MKPYPRYKDSGVEWLGRIPDHWKCKKIKHITQLQGGFAFKSKSFTETGIPIVRIGDIQSIIDWECCKKVPQYIKVTKDFLIKKHDTLIALSGATTGKTTFIDSEPEYSYINQRVAKASFDNKMIYFLLSCSNVQELIKLIAAGSAQENISNAQIGNITVCIPSDKQEQTAIATFLDRKTAEIDKLIANKERLIELYEEKKQAVINQAVTKGLDPDAEMKDSGVEWLGEIPKHWEVTHLKYLIKELESGVSVNATDHPAIDNDYGVLKTSCVYNYEFTPEENKAVWPEELSRVKTSPRKGEIIISRMNTPELVGASGYVNSYYQNLFLPDRLWQTLFYSHVQIDTYWLSFIFKSSKFRELLSVTATGSSPSMKNLAKEDFLNISIPFPLKKEQTTIVHHIETQCNRIDAIINKLKKQINLFKEYRTALISEVVTGKVDVRNESIRQARGMLSPCTCNNTAEYRDRIKRNPGMRA